MFQKFNSIMHNVLLILIYFGSKLLMLVYGSFKFSKSILFKFFEIIFMLTFFFFFFFFFSRVFFFFKLLFLFLFMAIVF